MGDRDARENLHLRTLQAVAGALDCRSGTLWALQQPTSAYVPMAMMNVTEGHHPILGVEDDLPRYMLDTTWIVDVRQCREDPRITSYNVCYTKLLRNFAISDTGSADRSETGPYPGRATSPKAPTNIFLIHTWSILVLNI